MSVVCRSSSEFHEEDHLAPGPSWMLEKRRSTCARNLCDRRGNWPRRTDMVSRTSSCKIFLLRTFLLNGQRPRCRVWSCVDAGRVAMEVKKIRRRAVASYISSRQQRTFWRNAALHRNTNGFSCNKRSLSCLRYERGSCRVFVSRRAALCFGQYGNTRTRWGWR